MDSWSIRKQYHLYLEYQETGKWKFVVSGNRIMDIFSIRKQDHDKLKFQETESLIAGVSGNRMDSCNNRKQDR